MGMFDTVIFRCPKCGGQIEEQSKAGECLLKDYNQKEVPVIIAISIEGNMVYCNDCDKSFIISKAVVPQTVSLSLIDL